LLNSRPEDHLFGLFLFLYNIYKKGDNALIIINSRKFKIGFKKQNLKSNNATPTQKIALKKSNKKT
tara:strand:- start:146 stop:343 length:198 start_codon:yes stop_codon:yes gene_type:complete